MRFGKDLFMYNMYNIGLHIHCTCINIYIIYTIHIYYTYIIIQSVCIIYTYIIFIYMIYTCAPERRSVLLREAPVVRDGNMETKGYTRSDERELFLGKVCGGENIQ